MMDPILPDEESWEYLDPHSVKRGPFSASRMAVWYDNDMLPEDLRVRFQAAMPYLPIRELFHPPLKPFRSRPNLHPVLPTPQAKAPAQDTTQCEWEYIDTKGQKQGPFPSTQMALWHQHGMLPKSLHLKRSTDSAFGTIAEYFPSPLVPFKSPPVVPTAKDSSPAVLAPAAAGGAPRVPATPGPTNPQQPKVVAAGAVAPGAAAAGGQNFPAPLANLFASAAAAAAASHQQAVTQAGKKGEKGEKGDSRGKGEKGEKGEGRGKAKGKNRQTEEEGPEQQQQQQTTSKKGRGKNAKDNQQNANGGWTWSAEHSWTNSNDNSWWEWNSWDGWSAAADGWENGKQGGVEWKGHDPIGAPREKGEKGNAVQAAFGSLNWGPPFKDEDLFPEEPIRRVLDEGIVWEERWISPLAVRFSQGKIHPFFHERGPVCEVMLQIKLNPDPAGARTKRIDPPFPPIRLLHLKEQGVLVTLDNRRLYALQRFALQEWPTPCLVRALCVDELTPTRLRSENRKFNNRLCGLQLEIESRSNAFDTFSWVTEAAHVEAARFLRAGLLRAFDRAISLLPVLVVHALMSKKLRPLLQSRWPALHFLSITLRDPQKRQFQQKRLLLEHVLQLSKPSCKVLHCPRVCVGFKSETVVSLSKGKSCVTSKLSMTKPLALLEAPGPLSGVQRQVLMALLPMFCLPYARAALHGATRDWVVGFLLAWGKVAAANLQLPG
eukprot:TRINITY_DN11017_c0_g1_i1.p1 TRINITY_DN11017_c0_g1~~TRINITY_DN11017_c0_g1_i1.p1  ORF type:complete len:716 (-),score=131.15 TRINITY_DN11017_c0_g1_i1:152-2299(-)